MESLSHAFQAGDPRSLAVRRAIEEVVRLGHEMQAVLDYALPQPAQALSCSLLEIACSARTALQEDQRPLVLLATENRRARVNLDGTLLSRSLARVLETALSETRSPVLLRSRLDGCAAVFCIVQATPRVWSTETSGTRFHSVTSALGAEVARRDVERMGGHFAIRNDSCGSTVIEIRFPAESVREVAT
jgi:hypothetical protein